MKRIGSLTIDEFVKKFSKPCLIQTVGEPCPDFRKLGGCLCDCAEIIADKVNMEVEVDE